VQVFGEGDLDSVHICIGDGWTCAGLGPRTADSCVVSVPRRRVIMFDRRGMGSSERGLGEPHRFGSSGPMTRREVARCGRVGADGGIRPV